MISSKPCIKLNDSCIGSNADTSTKLRIWCEAEQMTKCLEFMSFIVPNLFVKWWKINFRSSAIHSDSHVWVFIGLWMVLALNETAIKIAFTVFQNANNKLIEILWFEEVCFVLFRFTLLRFKANVQNNIRIMQMNESISMVPFSCTLVYWTHWRWEVTVWIKNGVEESTSISKKHRQA